MTSYSIGRESTKERAEFGKEHSAAWHVLEDGRPFEPFAKHMFVTRHKGKQLMSETTAAIEACQLAIELAAAEGYAEGLKAAKARLGFRHPEQS